MSSHTDAKSAGACRVKISSTTVSGDNRAAGSVEGSFGSSRQSEQPAASASINAAARQEIAPRKGIAMNPGPAESRRREKGREG